MAGRIDSNLLKEDYHGHPSYIGTWAILVLFFGLSLLANYLGNMQLAVGLIFVLAIMKTLLVVSNFMHVRWEPKTIWFMAIFGLMCVFFLYFGVMPDILWVPLQLAH